MALFRHSTVTTLFYRYALTTLIMLIVTAVSGSLFCTFPRVTMTNWIIFGITWVTTGSGAIFIYYTGLKKVSASVATICELIFPITSILLDYFVNNRVLSPVQLASAGVIVSCILLISLFPAEQKTV